jgi:uncharacterized membrane protein
MNDGDRLARLEAALGRMLGAGVTASAACLATGLLAFVLTGGGDLLLQIGLGALVATPILRVLFSFLTYVREHDWLLSATTLVVLLVLAASFVTAWGR